MKTNLHRCFSFLGILGLSLSVAHAQLPVNTYFYYHTSGGAVIYNYNTTTNTNSTNTIIPPAGNIGLAVNNNYWAGPAMTFYTVVGGTFRYWDGSTWANTGHSTPAINIGGAGPYMYSYEGSGGTVYRYNGTGPATLILSIPAGSYGGPYDVTGDASGNFFIMKTGSAPHNLKQYSPTGVLLQTYTMTGFPNGSAGGGFAFINGKLYADISGVPVWGTITGTNIVYGGALSLSVSTGDFANWPLSIVPLPIELVSFEGAYNVSTRMNELEWTTSTEINNDYFTLEFSSDGNNWEFLNNIDGAGYSNETQTYTVSHDSPYKLTYYRLTQTDYDGESKSYDPIAIEQHGEDELSLVAYPNPATEYVIIESFSQTPIAFELTDETGRVVHRISNPSSKFTLDVSFLENGVYFASSHFEDGVKTVKFIKR